MLEQATDVPAGRLRQVGVGAFAKEQGLAGLPEALVHVHATAVVREHRLGHEGGRFAVFARHVAHHVLVDHHVVGRADQLGKLHAQFVLGGGDFVVLLLDRHPQGGHGQQHFAAHVLEGVVGGNREIAFLQLDFVGQVAAFFEAGRVPGGLNRIDAVEAAAGAGVVANVVKDEELGLRAKEGRIGQAGGIEVIEGFLGQGPGAAAVGLAAAGLLDRADQAEGFVAVKGVDPGGVRVRHHRHIRLVDRLPAADRGAVKGQSFREALLLHQIGVDGEVLPFAVQISELQVDQFDALVLDQAKDVLGCFGHDGGIWGGKGVGLGYRPGRK